MDTNIQTLYTFIHDATGVLQKMMSKNIETETLVNGLEAKVKELEMVIEGERQSHVAQHDESLKIQGDLEVKLDVTKQRVLELEKENQKLFDESQSMRKVSQIIAFEKENGKLRKEIVSYQARIEELSHLQPKIDMSVNTERDEDVEDVEEKTIEKVEEIVEKAEEVKGTVVKSEVEIVEKAEGDVKSDEEIIKIVENVEAEGDVKSDEEIIEKVEEEPEDTEEADISVFEKKIKGKLYYVSDDDIMNIFTILPDGGIGDQVGRYEKESDSGKLKPMFY